MAREPLETLPWNITDKFKILLRRLGLRSLLKIVVKMSREEEEQRPRAVIGLLPRNIDLLSMILCEPEERCVCLTI